jgi:hypothetical protein
VNIAYHPYPGQDEKKDESQSSAKPPTDDTEFVDPESEGYFDSFLSKFSARRHEEAEKGRRASQDRASVARVLQSNAAGFYASDSKPEIFQTVIDMAFSNYHQL